MDRTVLHSGRLAVAALGIAMAANLPLRALAEEPPASTNSVQLKKMSLEDLMEIKVQTVYAASKFSQKTSEAPASVSILTQEDIQDFGYQTLGDVLNSVRGFYVDFDRGYSVAGLRGVNRPGSYGDGILLMINGHRQNDDLSGSAYTHDDFPLDLDLIDRIEVIRGAGSALYGDNAFFGVVNVITRQGRDLQGFEISSSGGSLDTYTGRLSYGYLFTNGVEVLVSATYLGSGGNDRLYFPEFNSINHGIADNLDWEQVVKLFGTVSYRDFTLEGAFNDHLKSLPTAAYGTAFDAGPNTVRDRREYLELRWHHEYDSDWTLDVRGSYDTYQYRADEPFNAGALGLGLAGQTIYGHDLAGVETAGGELQADRTFFEKHRVLLGLEGRDDYSMSGRAYFDTPPVTVENKKGGDATVGVYAQDEYSICTNLILDAGGRFDHYSLFDNTANPRGGLLYSPWTTTTFKLLGGQAYRTPNAYEFANSAPGYLPNYNLKPETIQSLELDWEQQLSKPLSFTTAVFYNGIHDAIQQVAAPAAMGAGDAESTFLNTGRARIVGAEAELDGRWDGLRLRLSYTYANGRDLQTGAWLSDSPHDLAKLNLAVPLYKDKVFTGIELQAMSKRQSADESATTSGFVLANLTLLSAQFSKKLEISASIYNLFDHRYSDPVGLDLPEEFVEQNGRTFRVKLTYRF